MTWNEKKICLFACLFGVNILWILIKTSLFCELKMLTDIDDCLIGLCGTHGTCNDKLNGYMCMCAPGFIGNNCETSK
jgi:Notch-like protein